MSLPNKWGKQNEKKRLNNTEQKKVLEKKYKIAEKQKIYHKMVEISKSNCDINCYKYK